MGVKAFVALCETLAKSYGLHFLPTPLLKDMAAKGEDVYMRSIPTVGGTRLEPFSPSQMSEDIHHLAQRIAYVKPAHAPGLIGERIENGETCGPGGGMDVVDIVDLDRKYQAPRCPSRLRGRC